ncbi:MAG: dihydrolipoyllysine-residue succinyltransferase component of 2-oxoglutarate dehydrogenase complex [Bacteroidia bacterium]|nr:MAG: dihydrolipoyllysine-residue succinyltransferase component of 2-oxoglutarate dehydrogenase complex [Bacteroidia bacterium]
MSVIELKVPSPGESVTEVTIARWLKQSGDVVEKDEVVAEIDSDKATLTLNAEEAGKLEVLVPEGESVPVNSVVAKIDTSIKPSVEPKKVVEKEVAVESKKTEEIVEKKTVEVSTQKKVEEPSPAAKKLIAENNIDVKQLQGTGKNGRITKQDVLKYIASGFPKAEESISQFWSGSRETERQKMSSLRKAISRRLVSVKNQTAMLTTFNEVDMSAVYEIRNKYKDKFKEKYNIGLGFMSFFTKAVCEALYHFPAVNAMIDGDEIVYHKYCDIGIAVSTPKGLMVPIIRNAETMSLAEIELKIKELATKAREGKLSIPEMEGGTFTITNGGVFGSMLSTPIINPPQSAILGMHNVVERPVAVKGKVEIRPVMYVALSYDHRIIDGRESVGFLYKVKELIENPVRLIFNGKEPEEVLLGL